jgi:hypothetical protein
MKQAGKFVCNKFAFLVLEFLSCVNSGVRLCAHQVIGGLNL